MLQIQIIAFKSKQEKSYQKQNTLKAHLSVTILKAKHQMTPAILNTLVPAALFKIAFPTCDV